MEKPGWAPFVFAGAVPRGLTDLLAITIIGLTGLEAWMTRERFSSIQVGLAILLLAVPLTCALASLSDTTTKLREELALLAYGGSSWHLSLRYFLRGLACTLLGITPYLYLQYIAANYSFQLSIPYVTFALALGGIFYSVPSLRRTRSTGFAENYKG